MDYGDILKRGWRITWQYKVLWVLGLFAGAGTGGGNGGSGYSGSSGSNTSYNTGSNPFTSPEWIAFKDFVAANLIPIVVGITVLVLISIVWWIFSVAARGGLVHLVNEAEEGRPVALGEGWRVGFSKWGRVFGVEFLTALPLLLFGLVLIGFFVLVIGSAVTRGVAGGDIRAAIPGLLVGGICFLGIFSIVALIVGTMLAVVAQLGIRYVVLKDMLIRESIAQGWRDLWGRRGAFVMYLVTIGVGIAAGIAMGLMAVVLVIPAVILFATRAWVVGGLLIFLAILLLMAPGAVYATFHSAIWTAFFRTMTGMQPAPAPAMPTYPGAFPPPAPGAYAPPAPGGWAPQQPVGYAPSAQPAPTPPAPNPWAAAAMVPPAPEPPAPEPPAPLAVVPAEPPVPEPPAPPAPEAAPPAGPDA